MSSQAASRQLPEDNLEDVMMNGAAVPEMVRPGQINPRDWHFGYSGGERELQTRAADTGYASIVPGLILPLRPFRKNIPNDTIEALENEDAPKSIEAEVMPRDAADALMSRYQHRGFRILMPFIGMNQRTGEIRAAKLFRIVHPAMRCKHISDERFRRLKEFDQKILSRHCVSCRLDDLNSDASLERIEKAKPGREQNIPYGMADDGVNVRFISEEEGLVIVHEMLKGALEEHYTHMMDTLSQSKADVEAGRTGPGKKKFDKRDDWYFLMTHKSANDIEAMEAAGRAQGHSMAAELGRVVSDAIKEAGGGSKGKGQMVSMDLVEQLVSKALAEQEKRIMANLTKAQAKDKEQAPTS